LHIFLKKEKRLHCYDQSIYYWITLFSTTQFIKLNYFPKNLSRTLREFSLAHQTLALFFFFSSALTTLRIADHRSKAAINFHIPDKEAFLS